MLDWWRRRGSPAPGLALGQTRDVAIDGVTLRLDLAPQVLSLEMAERSTFGGHEELLPVGPVTDGFVSASMLALKAKLFDDGLYAAVDTAMQPRKARLLAALAGISPPIAAAAWLGGQETSLSPTAQQLVREFLANDLASKPLGFYTWSDALRRIFQQDRLLQGELQPADAAALSAALRNDPALAGQYETCLAVAARLTNPWSADMADLRMREGTRFFPSSETLEGSLIKRLYGGRPIPEGFSLADEVIRAILAGDLNLEPTAASGWYDLQAWALEVLVRPDVAQESVKLVMGDDYRTHLRELAAATLALAGETHVKQLELRVAGAAGGWGWGGSRAVWIRPTLTVEPVPTYYQRRAQGYEFVMKVLDDLCPGESLYRHTPGGPVKRPLREELGEMTAIFQAAAAVSASELGLGPMDDEAAKAFRTWATDDDFNDDVRMMVPVFYDVGRRKTKVWAILGWESRWLTVSFATPPGVETLQGHGKIRFGSETYRVAVPVFAEAYVTRLLDRDEFRAHCDRYRTRDRILRAL